MSLSLQKLSTHAKIKYTELKLMDLLSLGLMCVKKIHHFLSGIKNMRTKENWFLFSTSRCTYERICLLVIMITVDCSFATQRRHAPQVQALLVLNYCARFK